MMPDIDIVCAKSLEENLGIRNSCSLPVTTDNGRRTFQQSGKNGPCKMDKDHKIERCFDCSQSGKCEFQKRSPWPATEIAVGCPI